jgi:uncharacterized protein (TIGR00725 family)
MEKYKIAVSGAAQLEPCCKNIEKLSREVGREIVKQGCSLVTGATTGVPYFAAQEVKKNGGISIGFSPAASEIAHKKAYKLPTDAFDVIVYTGFDYAGRNLLTLNEFTIAFEDQKPIGVLIGSGGTADKIEGLVQRPFRGKLRIIYEEDPQKLVKGIINLIKRDKGR